MALPETVPEVPLDQQIQEVPAQPEIPTAVEQATGVQAVPSSPQPLQGDNKQPIATPVPAPPAEGSIKIPVADQEVLVQMAKGRADDSQTWFGVFWLRKIKKAIRDGLSVLFGR